MVTTLAFLDGDLPITRDQLVDQLSEHVIGVASQTEARHQR